MRDTCLLIVSGKRNKLSISQETMASANLELIIITIEKKNVL